MIGDDDDEVELTEEMEVNEADEAREPTEAELQHAAENPFRVVATDGTVLGSYPTRDDAQMFIDGHVPNGAEIEEGPIG